MKRVQRYMRTTKKRHGSLITNKIKLFILTIAFSVILTACGGEAISSPTESVPGQENTTQQDATQGNSNLNQDNQSVSVLEVCPTVDEFLAEIQESYTVEENKGLGGGKWSTGIKLGGDKGYISITSMADTGKIVTLWANNTKSTEREINAVVSRYLTYITAFMKKIPDGYHDEESSWKALTETFTDTDTGFGMAKKISGVELEIDYNYFLSSCMVTLQIDVDETYKISKERIENYEKKLGSGKTTSAGNPKNEDIADYNQTDYVNSSKSGNTTSSSSGSSGQSSGGNSGKAGTSSSSAMSQHEHSYYLAKYVEATCKASGYRLYQCTGCSDTYKEEIPKTGHNYKAATCTAPQTCTKCGYTVGIKLPHIMYYTNCRYCDYTDFSCVAVATNKFRTSCFYDLLPGDGHPWGEAHYLQEGEASLNVDSSGQCEIFFDGYKLDFQLRIADYYPDSNFDVKFDCYKDGKQLRGSAVYYGFNKNRVQVDINLDTPELQDGAPGLRDVRLDLCIN